MLHKRTHSSSYSVYAQTQGDQTKKSIETAQTLLYEPVHIVEHHKHRFDVPLHLDLLGVVNVLVNRFCRIVLSVMEDPDESKIVVSIPSANSSGLFYWFGTAWDLLCSCSEASQGVIAEIKQVSMITISKETAFNRLIVTVTYPPLHKSAYQTFINSILLVVKEELSKLSEDNFIAKMTTIRSHALGPLSNTQQEISILKQLKSLFVDQGTALPAFKRQLKQARQSVQKVCCAQESLPLIRRNASKGLQELLVQSENIMGTLVSESKREPRASKLFYTQRAQDIANYGVELLMSIHLSRIKAIYLESMTNQCQVFNRQCHTLNKTMDNAACFKYLELKRRYTLPKELNPYRNTVNTLRQIQNCTTARDMLLVVQRTFSTVKTDCLEAHRSKVELSSMDDMLPVMIFVTVRAAIPNFPTYVKLVDDYVRIRGVFELEERVITTLYVAIEDITKKWTSM